MPASTRFIKKRGYIGVYIGNCFPERSYCRVPAQRFVGDSVCYVQLILRSYAASSDDYNATHLVIYDYGVGTPGWFNRLVSDAANEVTVFDYPYSNS